MLPINQRLRENRDFRKTYSCAKSRVNPLVVIYVIKRQSSQPVVPQSGVRIGFVVSKKQGNAVIRNRIRRRLREAARLCISEDNADEFDIIFVGRKRLYSAAWPEVQEAVIDLLKRSGITVNC